MDFDRRAIPPAASESHWLTSDGHSIRRIDWPMPEAGGRGSILFLPGRGDAYEKYLETLDHWHRQGWAVTASDWRGQAGSGRLGMDEVTGHIDDFSTWTGDLTAFWRSWSKERTGPRVLAGHSMGGHLVLRAVAEGGIAPDGLVLSAPMLGFMPDYVPHRLQLIAANLMCRLGDPRRPAWKWSEKPGELPTGRALLLTHDMDRYADESWWRAERPELVMGPGSWGWTRAALRSILFLQQPGLLEKVDTPVLMLAAEHDRLVSYRAIRRAAARLPNCELVNFGPEAFHELFREADPIRDLAVAAVDRFLDTLAPE